MKLIIFKIENSKKNFLEILAIGLIYIFLLIFLTGKDR